MKDAIEIEITTVHVEAPVRKLDRTWTCEEWTPPDPFRWYHRLWAWLHNLFGYASPYDTCVHGIDLEQELIDNLVGEIDETT